MSDPLEDFRMFNGEKCGKELNMTHDIELELWISYFSPFSPLRSSLPLRITIFIHQSGYLLAASLQYYIFGKGRSILLQPNLKYFHDFEILPGDLGMSEMKSSHGWINYLDIVAAFSFLLEINPLILFPLVSSG